MQTPPHSTVLAIDGGGSRCRIALDTGAARFNVETGPANTYTDFDGAVARIRQGLEALAVEAGWTLPALLAVPVYVGLAGVSGDAVAARLKAALGFETARFEDDRPAAIRAALGTGDGAVIHCGTGSFYALQRSGQIRLAGGWGPILGDEASAKWLGWSVLAATVKVHDGRLPPSALAEALLDGLGGIDALETFALGAGASDFGSLAPKVTEAAAHGEPLALSIVRDGARHIEQAVRAMGWTPAMTLCLTGGVAPLYKPYLPQPVQAAIRPPWGEPIEGALSLARELVHDGG
ncbi:MAG: hypothetical protein KI785_00840 [Devosiaceae bacterium]|nr:hypothetical protein [Devosiaceae bacterium MH13]